MPYLVKLMSQGDTVVVVLVDVVVSLLNNLLALRRMMLLRVLLPAPSWSPDCIRSSMRSEASSPAPFHEPRPAPLCVAVVGGGADDTDSLPSYYQQFDADVAARLRN